MGQLRLGLHSALLAALAIGCGTATPTAVPTSGGSALPGSPTPNVVPADEPTGPTSADLIRAARERGDLTAEDAAVYRVFAAFGDDRLPDAYRGDPVGAEDHLATRDAAGLWDDLSDEQREAIAPYFIPPIYAGSWGDPAAEADGQDLPLTAGLGAAGGPVRAAVDPKDCASEQLRGDFYVNVPAVGGKVRIWWRNGIETSARFGTIASTLVTELEERIWPTLTSLMGREPLSDAAVPCFNGEDGALDIYLSNEYLGLGTQALTIAYPGRCTVTPVFIIVTETSAEALPVQPWKLAHEFFHAIQFTYDYAGPCAEYAAMDEATATWAAEHVYPELQFEWNGYERWFAGNGGSLYNHARCLSYCSWPLFASITNRHGDDRVRLLYEATETVASDYDAIEIMAPGGIDAYWPQFVRDLWDDHEEHNVWRDWDPGIWSTSTYERREGGAGLVEVPRPGGGGILTAGRGDATHWWIAPWKPTPCVPNEDNPGWSFVEQETVGFWACALREGEDPPASYTATARVGVPTLGREEWAYWLPDEDWPRYVRIDTPGLGIDDEHLSVQGYYQLADGTWSGPHDWKGEDKVEFCRDDAAEDVRRIVILYGNSEVPSEGVASRIGGEYELEVRESCPQGFRIDGAVTGDFAGMPRTDLRYTGVADELDPDDPSTVTGEGLIEGTTIDQCYLSGGETQSREISLPAQISVSIFDGEIMASILPTDPAAFALGRFTDLLPVEGGTHREVEEFAEGEASAVGCGAPGTLTTELIVTPVGPPPSE